MTQLLKPQPTAPIPSTGELPFPADSVDVFVAEDDGDVELDEIVPPHTAKIALHAPLLGSE